MISRSHALRQRLLSLFVMIAVPAVIHAGGGRAVAQDRTLPEDFPLRLGDAFPTATGEATALASLRGVLLRGGNNRADVPVELDVGVAPRTQLSVGVGTSSDPAATQAGDVEVAARYQFWLQQEVMPSLAGRLSVTIPTGVAASAWAFEAKGYATRYVSTNLFVHLNAAAVAVDRLVDNARRLRYRLALGPSWILPQAATLMVAGDVYAEQGARHGDATTVGVEVGFRHRITASMNWHGAVGTEIAGPGRRAALILTTGVSYGFSVPGSNNQ